MNWIPEGYVSVDPDDDSYCTLCIPESEFDNVIYDIHSDWQAPHLPITSKVYYAYFYHHGGYVKWFQCRISNYELFRDVMSDEEIHSKMFAENFNEKLK